jgi:hypothetical protein
LRQRSAEAGGQLVIWVAGFQARTTKKHDRRRLPAHGGKGGPEVDKVLVKHSLKRIAFFRPTNWPPARSRLQLVEPIGL